MADNNTGIDLEKVDERLKEIDAMFENQTIFHRLKILFTGLGKPRSSREYKEAMIEMQRLSAPAAAVILPILSVLLLIIMSSGKTEQERIIDTTVMEAETIKDLEKMEEIKPPEEDIQDISVDIPVDTPNVNVENNQPVTPNQPVSPQPQAFDAVMTVKSPVILRNIYGSTRNTGTRGAQLSKFGGDKQTEGAVMNALRWLKKNQQADGSWRNQKIAMTGLAILTYLAHGEKPGDSKEFGDTVMNALNFLIKNQRDDGKFKGMDGNEYALPIATYALCEAYGMTLNPNVKSAAEKSLVPIIKGQHPTGGWTYKCFPGVEPSLKGAYRDDTSYMGWCAQALKAAKLSRIHADGLEKAIKLAIKGFKKNGRPDGGFGYCGPDNGGLTSVGTLCMMLLGASNDSYVKKSLDLLDTWSPFFGSQEMVAQVEKTVKPTKDQSSKVIAAGAVNKQLAGKVKLGTSPQYYFYYATQCKFHEGGKHWEKWNKTMKPLYVKAQIVQPKAIKDDKGKEVSIGHWMNTDSNGDRPVMDTCLAALQLMVYYRYLPTTSKAAVQAEEEIAVSSTDTDDISVDTNL